MRFEYVAALFAASLFAGFLLATELGRRIGRKRLAKHPAGLPTGVSAAEACAFAVIGLVLAFAFSGAATRFEVRRHLITSEINAIGTAYLRLDLLPVEAKPKLQAQFRDYVDVRRSMYRHADYPDVGAAGWQRTVALQQLIWRDAVQATQQSGSSPQATTLVLQAMNQMIDISAERTLATMNHPPAVIFLLLAGLCLAGGLLTGYSSAANAQRSWFHAITLAGVLSLTGFVVMDLEYPRLGFFRVDNADLAFDELRNSMR